MFHGRFSADYFSYSDENFVLHSSEFKFSVREEILPVKIAKLQSMEEEVCPVPNNELSE